MTSSAHAAGRHSALRAVRSQIEQHVAGLLFVLGLVAPAIGFPLRSLVLGCAPYAERLGAYLPVPISYLAEVTKTQLAIMWVSVATVLACLLVGDIACDWRSSERRPLGWPSIATAVLVTLLCCALSICVLIGVVDFQRGLFRPL